MRNNLEVDDKIVVNDGGKKDGSKRFSLYDDSFYIFATINHHSKE